MNISQSFRHALVPALTAVLVAACSSGSQPSGLAPSTGIATAPQNLAFVGQRFRPGVAPVPFAVHPNRRKSWISPDAKGLPRLLFISDADTGTVDIFTMPALALKGQITGFTAPYGLCSDGQGQVWVADADTNLLSLYSRGGTLVKTLSDSGNPFGCAVNKKTGDLAVMNDETPGSGPGDVVVYKNATGSGTAYVDSSAGFYYYFGGYDPNGNLFVSALTFGTPNTFALLELPSGAGALNTISISGGTIYFPATVQWTSGYLAVGDQLCGGTRGAACIYWLTISGSTATITGNTKLLNYDGSSTCDVLQGVIAANGQRYFAGGNYDFCNSYLNPYANRWAFPAGGEPTNNSTETVGAPIGSAVSSK